MNNAHYTIRVGLFFLLGLALIWVTYETLGNTSRLKKKGYELIAGFDNLKELKTGDDIRMAGVRIGAVETTRLAGRRAEAVLRIDKTVSIASDATATIVAAGLLGTNYISIDLGSDTSSPLVDGAEIRTVVSPDLNALMTQLGGLGTKLDGALGAIGKVFNDDSGVPNLIKHVDQLILENREKVNGTISNLQAITEKVNQGEGTLGKLVNDPELHDQMLATVAELKAVADNARVIVTNAQTMVDQIKSGQGTLGALIYDDEVGDNIKRTAANLRTVSDKLAEGEGTLGKLLNDDSLYTGAQSTLQKAERALDGMNDSGPITAVGVVAKALF